MARLSWWMTTLAAACLTGPAGTARGQGTPELAAMQSGLAVASVGHHLAEPHQTVPQAPGQFARPPVAAATPARVTPAVKPFHMASQRPTISPYLNLYREEQDDTLPNYFAFVLPQLRQQQFAQQQLQELTRMQQQLQQAGTGGAPAAGHRPAMPAGWSASAADQQPFSYHSRFMNTGSYFSGVPLPKPPQDGQ